MLCYRTFYGQESSLGRNQSLSLTSCHNELSTSRKHKRKIHNEDSRFIHKEEKLLKRTNPLEQKRTQRIEDFMMEEFKQDIVTHTHAETFNPNEIGGKFSYVLNNEQNIPVNKIGMFKLHEHATKILYSGQLEQAKKLFQKGVKKYPNNQYFLNSLGVVEGKLGNYQNAKKYINMAIDVDRRSSPAYQSLGVVEHKCGNYESAVFCFRKALEYDKKNLAGYQAWGILEGEQGNVARARELFSKALTIFDQHLQSLNAWAELEWNLGNYEDATILVDRALEINSIDQVAIMLKAKLLWRTFQFEQSRELLQHLVEEDSGNSILCCLLGDLEQQIGNTIQAREHYREALRRDDNNVQAWMGLQQLEVQNANYSEAANLLNAALERFPQNLLLQHRLGQYFIEIGKYDVALKILLHRLSQTPDDGVVLHSLGRLYQKTEDFESAEYYFTLGKSASNVKEALACYESLADMAAAGGQMMTAGSIFKEGGKLGEYTSRYLFNWALYEKHRNNLVESQKLMSQAVSMDPLQVKIWQNLGLVEKRLGNINAALDCFITGLNIRGWDEALWHSYCTTLQKVDVDEAKNALEQACASVTQNGALLMLWGLMEWDNGDPHQARKIFQRGNVRDLHEGHPPLYEAWAQLERSLGNNTKSDQLLQQAENIRQFQEVKRKNQISQMQNLDLSNLENQVEEQIFNEQQT